MTELNPFKLLIVVTALILMIAAGFGIVAPTLSNTQTWADGTTHQYLGGTEIPKTPQFPTLPDLNVRGSFNESFAFSQELPVVARASGIFDKPSVLFDVFSPDKRIEVVSGAWSVAFNVQRYGTDYIIPNWYDEPIYFTNGKRLHDLDVWGYPKGLILAQEIVNNFNGSYSTFVIDYGSKEYEAFISFSPLNNYNDMVTSWNTGRGFNVWIYGNAYVAPDWASQIISYLSFGGALIGYFVYFIAYLIAMSSLLFAVVGLSGGWASGIIILLLLALIGGLLMFLRGTNDK